MSNVWWWVRWTFTVLPLRINCTHEQRYDGRWCLRCGKDTVPRKWRGETP
jgi:hypothetical protein